MTRWRMFSLMSAVVLLAAAFVATQAAAAPIGDAAFERTWARTDKPVADGHVSRTWMWGPQGFSAVVEEPYAEAPGGVRRVQYFDKSRMEITNPGADSGAAWYVSNGLLVVEMVSGQVQNGHNSFSAAGPAIVNVAGDADDPLGPTYATFAQLRDDPPLPDGAAITQRLDRAGTVTNDPSLATHGATAARRVTVPGIDHQVASPFWAFMTSSGSVWQDGGYTTAPLFSDPFYATGYPIAEAYWADVQVGGTRKAVLIQCFERRCLTWTPGNPPGWQVEAGNVGQHYYRWRYGGEPVTPDPEPEPEPPTPPDDEVTFGNGVWIVGVDFPAGTYRNSDSSDFCYWARLSGFGGTVDDINANNISTARQIVTIEPGDRGFESSRCGVWSNDLSPITTSPTSPFADGTYFVGTEVATGTWRNSDSSDGCYWARLDSFSGELRDINDNEFTYDPSVVTISAGDAGFLTDGCGTWTRVGG